MQVVPFGTPQQRIAVQVVIWLFRFEGCETVFNRLAVSEQMTTLTIGITILRLKFAKCTYQNTHSRTC